MIHLTHQEPLLSGIQPTFRGRVRVASLRTSAIKEFRVSARLLPSETSRRRSCAPPVRRSPNLPRRSNGGKVTEGPPRQPRISKARFSRFFQREVTFAPFRIACPRNADCRHGPGARQPAPTPSQPRHPPLENFSMPSNVHRHSVKDPFMVEEDQACSCSEDGTPEF
ncbi:hypothetical protein SKAU_G00401330 [Synaphobranchus kaupii]|uniref:Uncharacterized protein n=1 Tax=Synaphobranchus kaupii TaxID=118154 RepID=A0A9Q1E950_SYNKA|nr:hypothetical protein SKAU_G00401330 [Synaphobranchus kaupii]